MELRKESDGFQLVHIDARLVRRMALFALVIATYYKASSLCSALQWINIANTHGIMKCAPLAVLRSCWTLASITQASERPQRSSDAAS